MVGLIFILVFGTAIYQRFYYGAHETESKVKGFLISLVYWAILLYGAAFVYGVTLTDMNTFVKVLIVAVILASMVGLIFLMLKARNKRLTETYPEEKLPAVKEMFASMGIVMGLGLALIFIALPFLSSSSRK